MCEVSIIRKDVSDFFHLRLFVYLSMKNKIAVIVKVVKALEKNGKPRSCDVAPETKDPNTAPREKKA